LGNYRRRVHQKIWSLTSIALQEALKALADVIAYIDEVVSQRFNPLQLVPRPPRTPV
jgi:hypothetical protein